MHRRPYSGVFWLAKLLLTLGLENFQPIFCAHPQKTEMRGRGQLVKLDDDVASTWNSTLVRLQLHGAEVDGTWLKDFDIATLADAGGDSL